MAGFANKIKKLTGAFSKKGTLNEATSPFGTVAPPFGNNPFDMGGVSGMSAGGPPGMGNDPSAQQATASVDNKMVEENSKKIINLESRLSKVDVNISMVQRESVEVKKTVEKIDQSVLELLSLYEIVSNQVNPFVGEAGTNRESIERFEKDEKRMTELSDVIVMLKNEIDVLSQRAEIPRVAPETDGKISDIDTKIDAFADAMVSLHESIEVISIKTDELVLKTGQLGQDIVDLADTTSNISKRVDDLEKIDFTKMAQTVPTVEEDNTFENEQVSEVKTQNGYSIIRLDSIKRDPMSVVVLLNWIEFLMERVGRNNLMDALDYYVDIEWISENVRSEIMAYARGIDYYVEKPTWRLLPEDHTKSLLFIERLCGRKIDKNMLSTIDREMSKVKHGLEELYGI